MPTERYELGKGYRPRKCTRVQIIDKAFKLLFGTNAVEDAMDPFLPISGMDKYGIDLVSLALVWQLVSEKKNSQYNPAALPSEIFCLFFWGLWHINLCRLSNSKPILYK